MTRPDDYARAVQHFETPQGRAQPLTYDDLPAGLRLMLWLCAACTAAIIAMIAGMAVLHWLTVAAATLADPLASSPY